METILGRSRLVQAPFFFDGGNFMADKRPDGSTTVFIGHNDVYIANAPRIIAEEIAPHTLKTISDFFCGANVVVMSPPGNEQPDRFGNLAAVKQQSIYAFHIDQSFVLLDNQRAVVAQLDPASIDNYIAKRIADKLASDDRLIKKETAFLEQELAENRLTPVQFAEQLDLVQKWNSNPRVLAANRAFYLKQITDYAAQQEEFAQILQEEGYKVTAVKHSAVDVASFYSSVNAIPYTDSTTGAKKIIFPVYPENEKTGAVAQFDKSSPTVQAGTLSRSDLRGTALEAYDAYASLGYTPYPVPDCTSAGQGSVHCLTNVFAGGPSISESPTRLAGESAQTPTIGQRIGSVVRTAMLGER